MLRTRWAWTRGHPLAASLHLEAPQWLIIQGRLLGKALAPVAEVTVAPFLLLVEQQPQPDGWRSRP
jgi:hypothetical protein